MSAKVLILGAIVMFSYIVIFGMILAITKNKKKAKELESKKMKIIREIIGAEKETNN